MDWDKHKKKSGAAASPQSSDSAPTAPAVHGFDAASKVVHGAAAPVASASVRELLCQELKIPATARDLQIFEDALARIRKLTK